MSTRNNIESNLVGANYTMGIVYLDNKQPYKAVPYFLRSYQLSQRIADVHFQFDNITKLIESYIQQNRINEALNYLNKAEELIITYPLYRRELTNIYTSLALVHIKTKDFEKASIYQQKYIQLMDSIFRDDLNNDLRKLEIEYQERENNAKLASQQQILDLKEKIIAQQNITNISIGCIAVLLIIAVSVLYRRNKQKRMINRILDEKVNERTRALNLSQKALLEADREMEALIHQTSKNIDNSLQTIKGICVNGLQEISDPDARQYIEKVNLTAEYLTFALRNFQSIGDLKESY